MAISLDHTIVPARNRAASARFFASIFGLRVEMPIGHFAAVKVNDTLTLDFADQATFESHHYAFHVSDAEFDAIFARVQKAGLAYSSDPHHRNVGEINHRRGGRGFYFYDPDGHNLEVLTHA